MENFSFLLLVLLGVCLLLRLVIVPFGSLLRLGLHCSSGLVCLWLLNTVSSFTGISFPLNAVTVAMAGLGGLPGIAAIGLLSCMT